MYRDMNTNDKSFNPIHMPSTYTTSNTPVVTKTVTETKITYDDSGKIVQTVVTETTTTTHYPLQHVREDVRLCDKTNYTGVPRDSNHA